MYVELFLLFITKRS